MHQKDIYTNFLDKLRGIGVIKSETGQNTSHVSINKLSKNAKRRLRRKLNAGRK